MKINNNNLNNNYNKNIVINMINNINGNRNKKPKHNQNNNNQIIKENAQYKIYNKCKINMVIYNSNLKLIKQFIVILKQVI